MQLEIDAHEKILFNGEGLTIKLDRLTQYVKHQEALLKEQKDSQAAFIEEQKTEAEKFQWTLPNIIALLSLISTIGLGVLMFIKGV